MLYSAFCSRVLNQQYSSLISLSSHSIGCTLFPYPAVNFSRFIVWSLFVSLTALRSKACLRGALLLASKKDIQSYFYPWWNCHWISTKVLFFVLSTITAFIPLTTTPPPQSRIEPLWFLECFLQYSIFVYNTFSKIEQQTHLFSGTMNYYDSQPEVLI